MFQNSSSYHNQKFSISNLSLGGTATEAFWRNDKSSSFEEDSLFGTKQRPPKTKRLTDFTLNMSHLCRGHPTRAYVTKLRSIARFPEASCARNLGRTRCHSRLLVVWSPVGWSQNPKRKSLWKVMDDFEGHFEQHDSRPCSPMQKQDKPACQIQWIATLVMPQSGTKSIILTIYLVMCSQWLHCIQMLGLLPESVGFKTDTAIQPPKGGSFQPSKAGKATQVFCSSSTACLQPELKSRMFGKALEIEDHHHHVDDYHHQKKDAATSAKIQLHPWHMSMRFAVQAYRWNRTPSSPKRGPYKSIM